MQDVSISRAYVVLIICNLFGSLAVYAGWRDYCLAKATVDWPSTAGEIVSSEVVGSYTDSVKSYWAVRPVVRYVYNVDGQQLEGDRLTLGLRQRDSQRSEEDAQATIAKYPQGQQVRVFYSPNDPTQSVLEPGAPNGLLVPILIGMLIVGFATTFVVSAVGLELLPRTIQFWLRIRMAGDKPPKTPIAGNASLVAWASEIRETVCSWEPGVCVNLRHASSSSMDLLFYSALVGSVLGMVSGSFAILSNTDNGWLPGAAAVNVFAVSTLLLFSISRLQDRRSNTTIDWLSATYEVRRDLAFAQRGPIRDISSVIVRCHHPRKHVRKFYATVELRQPNGNTVIAQNDQLRRKATVATQHAAHLAEPLAEALGVPVTFEGYTDSSD